MAVPELQAFHQQTRALLNRIALGGMKIDLQRGHRYTHPSFKGLPFNSTGSMNRMSFMTKAENDTPLEGKVMAGGARTQKAQEHYQKKLKGVAEWTRNQQLMKEGLPPNPPNPEDFQLSMAESVKLEIDTLLTNLNNFVEEGSLSAGVIRDFSNLIRLVIRFASFTTDSKELVDMIRTINETAGIVRDISIPSVRGNQLANRAQMRTADNIFTTILNPVVEFLEDYADYLKNSWDGDDKSRFQWIKDNVKTAFSAKVTTASAVRMAQRDWADRSRGIGVDFGETPGGQSDASTPAFQSGNTTLPRTPLSPMSPPDFLTVAEMREELRRRGVRGFSQMNRDQLIEALSGSQ